MDFLPVRRAITFSSPTKAPPQMNRMLVVSTGVNSWCGCLRPPCGGTLATVPSRIFSSACCTPFARDVAGDRRVLVLAADLVDLVDVDDALLALLHIAIGRLQQLQDDVLDILAHVAGFGQGGGVHDGERHVQDLRQGLRHQGLAGAGGADQQNVGLLQLHLGVAHAVHVDPLAVVVDRHRQFLLGGFLADHVLIQKLLYFQRLGDLVGSSGGRLDLVVLQNRVADRDALVADVRARIVAGGRDQLSDYVLALMAKRTPQSIIGSGSLQAVFSCSAFGSIRETTSASGVENLNRFRLYYHLNTRSLAMYSKVGGGALVPRVC